MTSVHPRELSTYPSRLVTAEVSAQVTVKESADATWVTLHWSRFSGSLLLLLAAAANLICAYQAKELQGATSTLSSDFQAQIWILMALHAISLVLSYTGLAQILNRTTIQITRSGLKARTLPLVTLMNGSVELPELQVREVALHRYGHWDGTTRFHLLARTLDGRARALIFGLADGAVADFLIYAIEEARAKYRVDAGPVADEEVVASDSDTSKAA